MTKATISSKGQIAIPKAIRDQLHLKAGMQVAVDVEGETIVIRRFVSDLPHWRSMRGMFQDVGELLSDLGEERGVEVKRDADRLQSF